ncbi:hypothetical protein TIFTF001_016512 [Ficus carica]|uniref:Uncharacterized protein n=1 Tax=Ficus carica TaxID=3494 RepID=A0AA88ANV1_FICCA|nr:hypothetical protein TIFTF001_016512 [Ficus carica]
MQPPFPAVARLHPLSFDRCPSPTIRPTPPPPSTMPPALAPSPMCLKSPPPTPPRPRLCPPTHSCRTTRPSLRRGLARPCPTRLVGPTSSDRGAKMPLRSRPVAVQVVSVHSLI